MKIFLELYTPTFSIAAHDSEMIVMSRIMCIVQTVHITTLRTDQTRSMSTDRWGRPIAALDHQ